ncbi:MAG: alkaline phosphatase family protein [Candidatus Hydrogenedentales bacterium]|jgi:predicted AlkP superfamily phosphohydrolase/phosphomutase
MKRVILIGLDGFSPELVEKWMGAGRLPALAALKEQGLSGALAGLNPPVTFPVWSSCVCGVNPGVHGLVDFTEMQEGVYALRFMNSRDRKAPALWNILSEADRRVCVLGVPGSYPPEPVNGILAAGFDSPVANAMDRSFVYPPEAFAKVKGWHFADFQEHRISPAWYGRALHALEQRIAAKESIILDLLQREAWDFFMVVLGEADTASHHFWALEDEQSPRHNAAIKEPTHPLRRIYERLDRVVARIAEYADEDTLLLVVSDHGFGGADTKVLHLNNFLAEQGWLRFAPPKMNLLKKIALRWVPVKLRGSLFRRFQAYAEQAESRSRFGGIDWRHTRAWSDELDYLPSVRLNVAGREGQGVVAPESYDAVVGDLCRLLETLPGVVKAHPRAALYTGPYTHRAPDILLDLDWSGGYRYSCARARGGAVVEELSPERWAGGKEAGCSGVHKNPAYLAMNRPTAVDAPGILDIAPTVLEYLGVDWEAMEGRSLLSGRHPENTSFHNKWTPHPVKLYTEDEERLLEERMRLLGYYE